MTDYNDGKWRAVSLSDKPGQIHDRSLISYVWHNKHDEEVVINTCIAGVDIDGSRPNWENIICLRVVEEYILPREFWVNEYADKDGHPWIVPYAYISEKEADMGASPNRIRAIKLIEVREE